VVEVGIRGEDNGAGHRAARAKGCQAETVRSWDGSARAKGCQAETVRSWDGSGRKERKKGERKRWAGPE
jgi:hypothetical protein